MKIKQTLINIKYKIEEKIDIINSKKIEKSGLMPDIRGTDETIDYLLSTECSMSRLGDGEFMHIFAGGESYQKYNPQLREKLIEILHSNIPNHIVCISDVFGDLNERNTENKKYWVNHLRRFRCKYYEYIDMNKTYYNTSATRVYKLLEDKSLAEPRFKKWKKLWNDKDIVFIEGSKTRMGVGNDLFDNARSIRRIIGPAENAFEKYKEILNVALSVDKDCLFILALGPTATVLSYELAKRGYRALDLGHIDIEYEWFLKEDSNIKIQGKYVNEVVGGNVVEDSSDLSYASQIVARIEWDVL